MSEESLNKAIVGLAKELSNTEKKSESIRYGKAIKDANGNLSVLLDGATEPTPAVSYFDIEDGTRVSVEFINRQLVITGSTMTPAMTVQAANGLFEKVDAKFGEFENLYAEKAEVGELVANSIQASDIIVKKADIESLEADVVNVKDTLTAPNGEFYDLEAAFADFRLIKADYAQINVTLETSGLVAEDGNITNLNSTYANTEFSNIENAAVNNFYSKEGTIGAASIDKDGIHVAGDVVGVNINADTITAGTMKADRLLLKGENGLYYELNTQLMVDEGITLDEFLEENENISEDDLQTKLHGSNIIANTITADQIYVDDLSALDATIGGFHITQGSVDNNIPGAIYSGVKQGIENPTDGIYMDDEGQFYLGNNTSYLKFYKDKEDNYQLAISASSLKLVGGDSNSYDIEQAIEDASKVATNYIVLDDGALIIGNLNDENNPSNVMIDSHGVNIRNSDIVVSAFRDQSIRLGSINDDYITITNQGLNYYTELEELPIFNLSHLDDYEEFEFISPNKPETSWTRNFYSTQMVGRERIVIGVTNDQDLKFDLLTLTADRNKNPIMFMRSSISEDSFIELAAKNITINSNILNTNNIKTDSSDGTDKITTTTLESTNLNTTNLTTSTFNIGNFTLNPNWVITNCYRFDLNIGSLKNLGTGSKSVTIDLQRGTAVAVYPVLSTVNYGACYGLSASLSGSTAIVTASAVNLSGETHTMNVTGYLLVARYSITT